jgi:hypothetical protein
MDFPFWFALFVSLCRQHRPLPAVGAAVDAVSAVSVAVVGQVGPALPAKLDANSAPRPHRSTPVGLIRAGRSALSLIQHGELPQKVRHHRIRPTSNITPAGTVPGVLRQCDCSTSRAATERRPKLWTADDPLNSKSQGSEKLPEATKRAHAQWGSNKSRCRDASLCVCR